MSPRKGKPLDGRTGEVKGRFRPYVDGAARPVNRRGRPDAEALAWLPLHEVVPPQKMQDAFINDHNSYLRCFTFGECTVILTREYDAWHLSIGHPGRYPTWDELAQARYRMLPKDLWFCMYLPPPEQYVNIHKNVFHLFEIRSPDHAP